MVEKEKNMVRKKPATKAEKEHMNKVAKLGCIVCRKQGNLYSPAELHHIRDMTGMGQRASHYEVLPLCVMHHRIGKESFHYSKKDFENKWGRQKDLLAEVLQLLEEEDVYS